MWYQAVGWLSKIASMKPRLPRLFITIFSICHDESYLPFFPYQSDRTTFQSSIWRDRRILFPIIAGTLVLNTKFQQPKNNSTKTLYPTFVVWTWWKMADTSLTQEIRSVFTYRQQFIKVVAMNHELWQVTNTYLAPKATAAKQNRLGPDKWTTNVIDIADPRTRVTYESS